MKVTRLLTWSPVLFVRRLFSDSTLGLTPEASTALNEMKLSAGSVYGDRSRELLRYWNVSALSCVWFFMRNGWPFSKRLYRNLMKRFEGRTTAATLGSAYADTAFHYSAFLMLSMHRAEWLVPFLGDLQMGMHGLANKKVLDYGCGVSDIGILLAGRGADVTIADLDDARFAFVAWRYARRNLPVRIIRITDTETLPPLLEKSFDVVILTEVLEHVRDPLALLRAVTRALNLGGLLFCSMGCGFDRVVGGDHLPEALAIGSSENYKEFFGSHYELIAERVECPWLFRRRV